MRIIVTGAGGFVGQHVLAELADHKIIAIDRNLNDIPNRSNLTRLEGDIRNPEFLAQAFREPCDAVIHLATIPGGAAENDPQLAKSVNIDASMLLIDMASNTQVCPRFVFASSIAVFGKLPHERVIDSAPTKPTMLYGAHKLMIENWLETRSQRGELTGISLRLPGILARPKSTSGMKSAFLSDLFHALRKSENITIPVSKNSTSWVCSVTTAAKNIASAAIGNGIGMTKTGSILHPICRVKMTDLEKEIRRHFQDTPSIVTYDVDDGIQAIFGTHPHVKTPLARQLGYIQDESLSDLVTSALNFV